MREIGKSSRMVGGLVDPVCVRDRLRRRCVKSELNERLLGKMDIRIQLLDGELSAREIGALSLPGAELLCGLMAELELAV